MKHTVYRLFCSVIFLFFVLPSGAQVLINEICPSNVSVIPNDDGEYDDWIEIYNSGTAAVNLQGYGLSDDPTDLYRFTFPSLVLGANSRMIVFCSDRNQVEIVDHWEMAVSPYSSWKYFVGTNNPDTNWRNPSFNDGPWQSGTGGFGFGDGDDNTIIPNCNSVMIRKHFAVADTSAILKAILNIDYDDGFVAFLNGTEIARANLGTPGDRPVNTVNAALAHEAVMYQGMSPDSFYIDPAIFKSLLKIGDNVLAIQVHNTSASNPDLSCIPFLTFGVRTTTHTWPDPPAWFGIHGAERYQADFKLARLGETIYLSSPGAVIEDEYTYQGMEMNHSTGRLPDGAANWCYFETPTPAASNNFSTCYSGYATIPLFSLQAGFYPGTQWLTLTTTQPGGVIRFTTDGKDVLPSSPVYTAPLVISSTQTVKAAVFAPGFLPSNTLANTYFINENIHYPVFCITTDPDNLYNYNTGIYVFGPNADSINTPFFGSNFWQDWEKPASIEFYDKSKNRITRFNADIKIYGNYSRAKPQKSFEIKMGDKYGMDEMHYSFYSLKPYIDEVNNIVLRNAGTDNNRLHFRDHLMEQNLKGTHCDYIAQEEVVLFLNGQFWGIYQIAENDDHHYVKNNHGYKEDEIDLLSDANTLEVKEGSDADFLNLFDYATSTPANDPAFYPTLSSMLDLENYADYFISETYYCNKDWIGDWTNNVKLWKAREPGAKWRYLNYDMDFGLYLESDPDDNVLGDAINPVSACYTSDLFDTILNNDQFRRYFINRYADLVNTIFLPSNMLPQLESIFDSMALDISRQYQQWGLTSTMWNIEHNKTENFIIQRPAYARDYVQSEFGLASQVNLTLNVFPANAGRIQISTVTPASLPWSGVYFNGNPVTITAIPNPGFTFDHWLSDNVITSNDFNQSATYNFTANDQITAYFTGSPVLPQLTFSELNYHSDSVLNSDDWIELHNYGSMALDISGWKFKDEEDHHVFQFPVNTVIPAGGYLVLAENLDKFSAAYPGVGNVTGPLNFSFANNEEQLRLFDYKDSLFLFVFYSDQMPWPAGADGDGYTCELVNPSGDLNDGNNWFAGCLHGSPGKAYTTINAAITAGGNLAFCAPGSVALSANTGMGYAFQWSLNGTELPGETSSGISAVSNGWYSVSIDSSGCEATDSVMVNAITVADPVVNYGYNCGSGSVTVSAVSASAISWYDAPNGNLLYSGDTYSTPYLSVSTQYFAVADSSGCSSNHIGVYAYINEITADPVSNDVSRCGEGTVTLSATDTAIIHWYDQPVGGTLLFTGASFTTPILSDTTVYYVEAGTLCPSARIAVTAAVTIVEPPMVTGGSRCGTGTVDLTASSTFAVSWYDQPAGGILLGSSGSFTTPVISTTTTFYAEAVDICPSIRIPAVATVNAVSADPVVGSSYHCGPGDVTLTANSADPVSWYDAPAGGNLLGTGTSLLLAGLTNTTVVYAEAGLLCPSARVAGTASIDPVPTVNLGADIVISSPQTAVLDAGAGFASYLWSTGETTQTILVSTTNTYSVTVTDPNGCTAMDDVMVTVYVGIASQSGPSSSLNIYPNPVREILTVAIPSSMSGEEKVLKMMDVTGRVVYEESVFSGGLHEIAVQTFAGGVYILTLESATQRRLQQVIIH